MPYVAGRAIGSLGCARSDPLDFWSSSIAVPAGICFPCSEAGHVAWTAGPGTRSLRSLLRDDRYHLTPHHWRW